MARFDAERRELFPAGRTQVGAHLTLFHAVPGELEDRVRHDLAEAAREQEAFDVRVAEVMSLGRGAAYRLEAPELEQVHRRLQRAWSDHLTPQDAQGLRAHVTVQNKVAPEAAKATVERLRSTFSPSTARAESLALWRYVGGPWEPVETFAFAPGTD
ncbi:2'-5' RNA ligase family protein [Nocardioides sp. YIM 123512]|uniref:2'-5' RNA ligase family protein n=2 Tax=Nocardioides flavescens TaxID=2691959 RepID=A0A6L7ERY0_9ACTN|nr:2'-5' RNA ligase family protein [Nocardioides flavescens]MXG90197.1 2'-5' RNA ligase family protein [Nocardioides flavescens]